MNVVDLIGQLPVHATKKYGTRTLDAIEQYVLHHTDGPPNQSLKSVAEFHVHTRGWPGFAYHFAIRQGIAYKCWPATTVTYCVKGENTKSLCVVIFGKLDDGPVPLIDWTAAVELMRDLRADYGPWKPILGHKEALPDHTACPGRFVDMHRFRTDVAAQDT